MYTDDTPAIFYSIDGATKVKGLMDEREDISLALTTQRVLRGQLTGYTVTCRDKNGHTFKVSNDMVERLYGRVT